jgi:hypothetical protein
VEESVQVKIYKQQQIPDVDGGVRSMIAAVVLIITMTLVITELSSWRASLLPKTGTWPGLISVAFQRSGRIM